MQFEESDFQSQPTANFDDADFGTPVEQKTSVGESFARGGAQGLTSGFADEITGAYTGLAKDIGEGNAKNAIVNLIDKFKSASIPAKAAMIAAAPVAAMGIGAGGGVPLAVAPVIQGMIAPTQTQEEDIAKSRENYAKAAEAHPIATIAGNVAGSLAPALIPGANVATGAKAGAGLLKTLPGMVARGAGEGALAGVGYSDADTLEKGAKGAAGGALMGGVAGAAFPILGRGIKALKGKTGARILSGVTEVPEEAIQYAMNPATRAKMATTKTMPIIGEEIIQKADDVVNNIRKQSGESFKLLKNSDKSESVYGINTIVDGIKKDLSVKNKIGTYDAVINDLDTISNRLLQEYQLPSGQAAKAVQLDDIKNIIWSLDDKIVHKESALKPLSPAERVSNNAYKELRGKLNDRLREITKDETGKSTYAELMDKISSEMQDMKNFRDAFKSNPETLGKQIAEYMKLERLGRDKTAKLKNIDTIAKYAGKDWMDEAKAVWSRDQFEKQVGKGSTNANVGIMAGGAIIGSILMGAGVPAPVAYAVGGAIGGVFGKIFNSYGSRMTKFMLEKYIESAEGKAAANVPHIIKKPLADFTRAMQSIPDSAQRRAVVNAMLQDKSMKENEQSQAPTPGGIKYAFDRIAR